MMLEVFNFEDFIKEAREQRGKIYFCFSLRDGKLEDKIIRMSDIILTLKIKDSVLCFTQKCGEADIGNKTEIEKLMKETQEKEKHIKDEMRKKEIQFCEGLWRA